MTGRLDVRVSDTPLAREHRRLLETALRRGPPLPEIRIAEAGLQGAYPEVYRDAAARFWLDRMQHEHRSSTVFSQLLPFLIAAEASLDMKTVTLRMAMDELRHAGLCGAVVELFGVAPTLDTELVTTPLPSHADTTARVAALRNVFFICNLNETIAVSALAYESELVVEPAIALALTQLAGDESLHGRFGWLYLDAVWPTLTDEEREAFAVYLPTAFAYLEDALFADRPEPRRRPVDHPLWGLGVRDDATSRELFDQTVDAIIVPALEAHGLPARRAWAHRADSRRRALRTLGIG
jgi:hypothetical protein